MTPASQLRASFLTIKATLRESRKRLDRGNAVNALWWIFQALEELEEARAIIAEADSWSAEGERR